MALPKEIIRLLSAKAGFDVDTPAGANRLSLVMDLKPETRLGRNTISRLTGVLPATCTPRRSTLDAIAKYLGHQNWVAFLEANAALKAEHYAGDPKFGNAYASGPEASQTDKYSNPYTMECSRPLDFYGQNPSQWSTWADYSFRIFV